MQVIKIGRQTYKLSETSGTLAKLQKCIDGQKKKTKRPAIKSDGKRYYPDISKCKNTADYVRQFYMLNDFKIDPAELFEPMRDAPIQFPLGIDGIEEIDDSQPDQFAADAVAELVASATAAAAIGQAMAPAVADARELETVGADCGPVEAATACDAITTSGHAQTGHGGPAGHAGGPDFGVRGMGPDPVFRGPAADLDPEPMGITGTHGNIGTRGNSEKMPEPVGISNGGRPPEHYQYLPTWAKIAIERLDADSDLRNGAMLDQLLNAYAASNGQECDAHIRASSHHICGRRFWNFAPLPTDPAQNPEPAEPVGIQAEPMEISAPLVDDTEPAGIPRNRDTDYYEWLIGAVSNLACARRITYREAAAIADPCRARMRSEYLAGASVHDMCRILGEINPEPVEPVAIADGGPVVFNADRREWVHAGTIEPEPVENGETAPADVQPVGIQEPEYLGDGTYSPEDNKLRFYPFARLDAATYARVKAAGFSWAPKQEIFVAPMWTPGRADLLEELAGEIGDEDKTMAERAADRSERFEEYHDKRTADAGQAYNAVHAIGARFEMGQPILIGHHSEKRARKDKERMDNGMRKAVKMWDTAKYWESRAAACVIHALYKLRPDVRARRIKGIESDLRKQQKMTDEAAALLQAWEKLTAQGGLKLKAGGLTSMRDGALFIANRSNISKCFTLAEFPRDLPASQYEGMISLYSAIDRGIASPEQAAEIAIRVLTRGNAGRARWIAHYTNRLAYERAMLADAGGLAADKFDIQPGGTVTHRGRRSVVVRVNKVGGRINSLRVTGQGWMVGIEEVTDYEPPTEAAAAAVAKAVKLAPLVNFETEGCARMTSDEWKRHAARSDCYRIVKVKATETAAAYRQRVRMVSWNKDEPVFITDAAVKPAPDLAAVKPRQPIGVTIAKALGADTGPEPEAMEKPPAPTLRDIVAEVSAPTDAEIQARADRMQASNDRREAGKADAAPFDALRQALKSGGVSVAVAPQLFPTPAALASRMVELADLEDGARVLEPSAGTGRLVDAIRESNATGVCIHAVEIDRRLCTALAQPPNGADIIHCADFTAIDGPCAPVDRSGMDPAPLGQYDAILMNPPFAGGADIAHIKHALRFLAPGGRLVAICAGGPRQVDQLRPIVDASGGLWEPLPAGTFKESGTGVNSVLLAITAPY